MNNYNELFEKEVLTISKRKTKPTILLHSCCGPCSTAVIERLKDYFKITVFYYNPNVEPLIEYEKRKATQLEYLNKITDVDFLDCDYSNNDFKEIITPELALQKEGEERCAKCFELRLKKTAATALNNFDYFGTTLTVSPHKNAKIINEIGLVLEELMDMKFLPADFKKNNGYLLSIRLANENELYRQKYCGCLYSKQKKED